VRNALTANEFERLAMAAAPLPRHQPFAPRAPSEPHAPLGKLLASFPRRKEVPVTRRATLFLALAMVAALVSPAVLVAQETKPLTNEDVVKLSKAGLGDDVVIAKINQAPQVDFKLDPDSLIALKQQGVSKEVISAMLKRTTPTPQAAPAPGPANLPAAGPSVVLRTAEGDLALRKMAGSVDYRLGGTRTYNVFAGAQSTTRTHDRNPSILLRSEGDPRGQYFVVKFTTEKGKRALRIGGGLLGTRNLTTPNEDYVIEYEASETQPGLWTLKLSKPLEPGEYGLFVATSNVLGAGEVYDFGVD
jgi:hypothetical protein